MLQLKAPSHTIRTSLQLSGSKSLSNRLLILKEVLNNSFEIQNISGSEDTKLLIDALEQLKNNRSGTIDIRHAGTDMRFLCAYIATHNSGEWVLTGSTRLQQRPVSELVNALQKLGAEISYTDKEGFPPLKIKKQKLKGGRIEMDGSISSQFISALLLVAPSFENGIELILNGSLVSWPYVEMTVDLLKHFGVKVHTEKNTIRLLPFSQASPSLSSFTVESDWSSASYWYSICALSPNSEIKLSFLSQKSLQADSVLPKLFEPLGVKTLFNGNVVHLSSSIKRNSEFNHDFTNCPDIAQTLAVCCFGLGIKATLTGLKTLKLKETDRIIALKTELEKFGIQVQAGPESLTIPQHSIFEETQSANYDFTIKTYHDHRMAMSFAPLALVCKTLQIEDPAVVDKSYPTFWQDLKSAGFNVNLQP